MCVAAANGLVVTCFLTVLTAEGSMHTAAVSVGSDCNRGPSMASFLLLRN